MTAGAQSGLDGLECNRMQSNAVECNRNIKAILLDLDGTVYWGDSEVEGAGEFVRWCEGRGHRCLFVTNRANRPPEVIRDQLRGYGIPCETADILTSGQATARILGGGSAYIIGEIGLEQALREQGIRIVTDPEERPDAVVVSYDKEFNYTKLSIACRWIGEGVRFIVTNTDGRLRMHDRILPGTGAIVAAVMAGSGGVPEIVGKPERRLFDIALEKVGCRPEEALVVGDFLDTDIGAANAAGIPSVLMLTGISRREDIHANSPHPTYIAETFAELTKILENYSTLSLTANHSSFTAHETPHRFPKHAQD